MNKMTWLDLYNFLHSQAHDFKNLGQFNWSAPVVVHDAETGEEYDCDTYTFGKKLTLAINMESVFHEKGNS
jgi:hypothetical protein